MEEINIFLDNKIETYYLSLFDNFFKDENYFKIGTYEIINDNLNVDFDNGIKEIYNYLKVENNIKYYGNKENIIENQEKKIFIHHTYWNDELILENNICYRINNNDKGKFLLNNDELIIKWDNYNEEKFIYNINENAYFLKDDEIIDTKNESDLYEKIILIKNFSWENEILLNNKDKTCIRLNDTKDKGIFNLEDNYLYIDWNDWSNETFYKIDNYYVNNNKFLTKKKFLISNKIKNYEVDKEYIYINYKKFKYKLKDKRFIINKDNIDVFIYFDEEYHDIDSFNKYIIDDNDYLFYKYENIILNNQDIIIAKFELIKENIYLINWYDNNDFYYKMNQNKLTKLISIKIKNKDIKIYYISNNLLYNDDFSHSVLFEYVNENEILIENNLNYLKEDDIFILNNDKNQKELILYDNEYKIYYYNNNYLFNSDSKNPCLIDESFDNIHVKENENILIYKKLINNIYITLEKYNQIYSQDFDIDVYNYFENNLLVEDNLIESLNNKLIYNNKIFNHFYIFLENIDFHSNVDIFEKYGYFIIQENNINCIDCQVTIINLKDNDNFINNQDLWIDYLNKNTKNIILIFDDYSYYEFLNEIFDFKKNYENYIIIINYTNCEKLIHFYLNKLLKSINTESNITHINYLIDINKTIKKINKQKEFVVDDDFYKMIHSKYDFIIFVIYFYIKNINTFLQNKNFSMLYTLYKNNTFTKINN